MGLAGGEGAMVAAGDPGEQPEARREWVPEAIAALVALGLYAVTIRYGFVFDDASLIGPDGPRALGNGTLPYRPLRYVSYGLDQWLGGGAAWAYHATNVVLHASVAALTAALARRLGARRAAAAWAGLVVATHPLAVEAAAYVAGRRDLLATLGSLVAVLAWTSPKGRTTVALLAVLAAVAAKESAALGVAILWLASCSGLGPAPSRAARTLGWLLAAAVVLPVAYGAIGPLAPEGPACGIANTVTALAVHYAHNLVWPLRLAVEYPALTQIDTSCAAVLAARSLGGFFLLGLAAGVAVASVAAMSTPGHGRPLLFTSAWSAVVFLSLSLVIGLHEPGADRHAYPLLPAVAVTLALGGSRLVAKAPAARGATIAVRALWVLGATALAVLTIATAFRLPSWRDARSLWERAVVTAPDSGRAHHNLAGVLLAAGDLDRAAREIRRARALGYRPALLGDAAIACTRGRRHRGLFLLDRARALGFATSDIEPIAASCEKEKGDSPLFPENEKKHGARRQLGGRNSGKSR